MLEIIHNDDGNLEISILNRKEFKKRTEFNDDPEDLLTDIFEEEGYYSYSVEPSFSENSTLVKYDHELYTFDESNKTIISELNKYGFAILNRI